MANGTANYALGRIEEGIKHITTRLDEGNTRMETLTTVTRDNATAIGVIKETCASRMGPGCHEYVTVKLPFLGWPWKIRKDRVGVYALITVLAIVYLYPAMKAAGLIGSPPLTQDDLVVQHPGTTNGTVVFRPLLDKIAKNP